MVEFRGLRYPTERSFCILAMSAFLILRESFLQHYIYCRKLVKSMEDLGISSTVPIRSNLGNIDDSPARDFSRVLLNDFK